MNSSSGWNAVELRTSEDLLKIAGDDVDRFAFADLTLGSWTPQSLPVQLLSQLTGRELAPKREASSASRSLGDSMSLGIDQEGKGNAAVIEAAKWAAQIAQTADQRGKGLAILLPLFNTEWRTADRLLLEYLAALYPHIDIRFAIVIEDQQASSRLPSAAKLPSTIAPSIANSLAEGDRSVLWRLPNGWSIVRPEYRRATVVFSQDEIQAVKRGPMRAFAPYAALHAEHPDSADPWELCAEAWAQFGGGYRELAVRYINAAVERARSSPDREVFRCHRQGMRVALTDYADASAEPVEEDGGMPTSVLGFLLETKGWGFVMSGNPKPALPLLRKAMQLLKPPSLDVTYLFLMNITALAEVRCGNFDEALRLEREIEDAISAGAVNDARLEFVNSLNLARLYRYSGDLDASERCYLRAFATFEGGRTMTDSVNANLCLARVHEGRQDHARVFECWLRAALHWVACDLPESLNWRVQSLVLGKGGASAIASRTEAVDLVERLAAAFLDSLRSCSTRVGVAVEPPSDAVPGLFALAGASSEKRIVRAVGGPGWGVLRGKGRLAKRAYGPGYEALTRWLLFFIERCAGEEDSEHCTFLDTGNGEMPQTEEELLRSAAAFGLRRCTFDGQERNVFPGDRTAERNPLISSAVPDAEGLTVSFRRYLPPARLKGTLLTLFNALTQPHSLSELIAAFENQGLPAADVEQGIEDLRSRHLIRVRTEVLRPSPPGPQAPGVALRAH